MKKLLIILAVLLLGTIKVFSQEQTKTLYDVYLEMGNDAYENGNYESAINWITKASEYAKNKWGENHHSYVATMFYLCNIYNDLGDNKKAIECGEKGLAIGQEYLRYDFPEYIVSLLNSLSYCYEDIHNNIQAIEYVQKAIKVLKEISNEFNDDYCHLLEWLGVLYGNIGEYNTTIHYITQVLPIIEQLYGKNTSKYAQTLGYLGSNYQRIGQYEDAVKCQEEALKLEESISGKNGDEYASLLNGYTITLNAIGNNEKAIQLGELAVELSVNDDLSHSAALNNLSKYYSDDRNYSKALEYAHKALEYRKNATTYGNISSYYSNSGNIEKAIEYGEIALQLGKVEYTENHPKYATLLNNMASNYSEVKDYIKSTEYTRLALLILENITGKSSIDYRIFSSNHCINLLKSGDIAEILPLWLTNIDSTRANIQKQLKWMTGTQRIQYWNTINYSISMDNQRYIRLFPNNNDAVRSVYSSLLLSKGLILSTDIEFDKVIRESGDTVLLEKFEELRTTRAILNTYYNKPIAERPEGEVERLEARAEVLEKDLLAGSKEYADFTRRLEIEWQDVQAALGDKDVAIEILAADEHIDEDTPPYYAALVLRKGWDAPKFVELCGAEELQTYFDSDNGLAMMYREANSRKLYDLIWGKLAEHINEGDNVYFSPGGLLHQVNVELLQDTDGRLANEKYNLHRVSSTRELCFEKPKIAHSEAVLYGGLRYDLDSTTMIAQSRAVRPEEEHYALRGLQLDSLRGKLNYLSASKTEVEKISKQMSQHGIKTTLYVEQIGNEESFKALSGKKTPIIHLATHGFFFKNEEAKVKPFFRMMSMDQERPRPDNSLRRSGLAFAGAQKAWDGEEIPKGIDDGVMLAQEIASMDLAGTDLVVLSACETGLGEINSEGVFGLQRAFKKAGVQTLIMSLWKVHDEATALFMQTFYGNLLSGKSKRDSFAAAQMALRKHRDYGKDPAYWAAFVMLD